MIYPSRFSLEPRLRSAYCEAFDIITVYGGTRKDFRYQKYDISRTEMKQIWTFAQNDANGKSRYDVCFG